MPSPFFPSKDKLTLALRTLRDVPPAVPVLFALAAFLVGYGCSAYAAWVSLQFANTGEGIYCIHNCQGAYESWYRNNQHAAHYASITPRLLVLSFPVAMTVAIFFAMILGWLPNLKIRNLLPGLFLLYCGSFATAVLAVLSFVLIMFGGLFLAPVGLALALLAVAIYIYSPVFARSVIAERDPSMRGESGLVFLASLSSIPFGLIIGAVLHWLFPTFILTYGIQVALGASFGASLALPRVSRQRPSVPVRVRPRVFPAERLTIERLVLALGAQVAVSFITMFQRASRPLLPGDSRPYLIAPFILTEMPFIILIYLLLKEPSRRAFTFLTAMLAFGIVETFFNPTVVLSYRQIYLDHPIGLMWPAFSGLIYIITAVLANMVIQKTGMKPKLWSAILGTLGMFCYFLFIEQITPYLNNLWN